MTQNAPLKPAEEPAQPSSTAPYNPRLWSDFYRQRILNFPIRKILRPDSRIFTMGSCFAMEIRRALHAQGLAVFPDYKSITYDQTSEVLDKIPFERDTLQHYDTFSMLQEFEAAFGLWPDRSAGYWPVTNSPVNSLLKSDRVFQDPYRKLVYARTRDALVALTDRITQVIRTGLDISDVVILTLGLTEVWQHSSTSRYICQPPQSGYGTGDNQATFRQSTFTENYANVRKILELLFARYPEKNVVISVSPVALGGTFSNYDVGTANTESKSILRAVAGQLTREFDRTLYFPSYEAAMMNRDTFAEDGRHVRPEFAREIVGGFIGAFS